MKAAVIVFPGSNCDRDVQVALGRSMGRAPLMVWHRDSALPEDLDLVVIPGGFSYGDYLRAGAMAAHSPVMRDVVEKARRGLAVLAICNGFQIATEAGLLPGVLMRNASLRFVCKDVHLRVEQSQTPFTARYEQGQVIRIPIGHAEGNYFTDPDTLRRLEDRGQIAFRYCTPTGETNAEANPNGSLANIAGIFNETRTVLGLMPHPERLADPLLGGNDGRAMFDSLVEALS
ncbi:MAG: phosphoribosylformylglycinamidine synthase subunit PurQ [Alphaproteobacteria bacterium]|nr:phosphoribosylformylglycinamidine synthase subunit PurQ [Alphaproteobacteria bacterium]